ncbi:MAG: hypothetical protein ACTSRG_00925 [Candidatus Helarchaeota archaeon]
MNKKLFSLIPFFVFLTFWILQIVSGFDVVVHGTTNPYADPLYTWIFWNMVVSEQYQHLFVWYYLIYGFQYSGAHPLQAWEFMFLIFVIELPVLVAFGLYIKKVFQET